MELIVISDSKIKIMLTPPDMRRYQVSSASSAPAPGPGLRRLLADIHSQCGLELCEDRLMVDLYTSDTGCEMFLTSLGPRGAIPGEKAPQNPISPCAGTVAQPCKTVAQPQAKNVDFDENRLTYAETALLERIRAMDDEVREEVLLFDNVHDLLRLCRRLWAMGFEGDSAVYMEQADAGDGTTTWYLWLTFSASDRADDHIMDPYAFLCEYAEAADIDHARFCRGEYWTVISAEDAVSILAKLA